MPKEIRSAVTRDASSASNDATLQELEKRGERPDPALNNDFALDLKNDSGSLQKTANRINRKTKP